MITTLENPPVTIAEIDPIHTAHGIYITLHGHFYQPPRENPYLNIIERQPSASPFHNWNERIHHECYRPNAFARILNDRGEIVQIINNYEYLSFNIGATLMSWLENHDPEVYQRILEADKNSAKRLNGHGNAIAQVYNHIIMPLANEQDKFTQIRWGKADFYHRFQREPEGMWLAETAVDYETLKVLIQEGIKFIILAPSQALRCRPFPTKEIPETEWVEVGGSQIDPTRPYRCYLDETHGDYIDIFFYDGPISRDMGFNDLLSDTHHFVTRLSQAIRGDRRVSQLINVATDGETFGHHKKGTEKCLAYGFIQEFQNQKWTVTNFAHYLSICPPTWEVQLKPVTSWSCCHGVDRWQDDCGCGGGGEWNQLWRKPLRNALDWLRDQLIVIYEEIGYKFFHNPWVVRDEYIKVILDRSTENVNQFLTDHQKYPLTASEKIDALRVLEMQRHALLMFTSCGWFFEEISRPEGTQILRYAGHAIELAEEVSGVCLQDQFIQLLDLAPSNVLEYKTGAEVYRKLVIPSQVTFKQVAGHYAISSLFTSYSLQQKVYCYFAEQLDYQKQELGALTLAIGQVQLTSEISGESHHYLFAVFHLGGWDFHCCIQLFNGRSNYSQIKAQLWSQFNQGSVVKMILLMSHLFGEESFTLEHLFAEERHRIMNEITAKTSKRLDQLYLQVYRDNYSILVAFQREELPVPQELQVAVEVALSYRCKTIVQQLSEGIEDGEIVNNRLIELASIANEAVNLRCQLTLPEVCQSLENTIFQSLARIFKQGNATTLETDLHRLSQMITISQQLNLGLCLDRTQELYCNYLHQNLLPHCLLTEDKSHCHWELGHLRSLLQLGKKLGVSY